MLKKYVHSEIDTHLWICSLATHLLLLMFELLAADTLESHRHYWILVFVPLVRAQVSTLRVACNLGAKMI